MKYILFIVLIFSSLSAQLAVSILDFKGEDVQDKLLRACYNQLEESFFVFGELFHCVTHVTHLFDSVNIHGIGGLWEISGQ